MTTSSRRRGKTWTRRTTPRTSTTAPSGTLGERGERRLAAQIVVAARQPQRAGRAASRGPCAASRRAVTGPAPGKPEQRGPSEDSSPLVREAELVVTEVEEVAFVDALVVDAHALEVDAVRRAEVLDEVGPVAADDGGVLARDVAVLDGQIGRLRAAADDELVLVDPVLLVVEDQVERRRGRAARRAARRAERRARAAAASRPCAERAGPGDGPTEAPARGRHGRRRRRGSGRPAAAADGARVGGGVAGPSSSSSVESRSGSRRAARRRRARR